QIPRISTKSRCIFVNCRYVVVLGGCDPGSWFHCYSVQHNHPSNRPSSFSGLSAPRKLVASTAPYSVVSNYQATSCRACHHCRPLERDMWRKKGPSPSFATDRLYRHAAGSVLLAVVYPGEHLLMITSDNFDPVLCESWADIPLHPLYFAIAVLPVIERLTLLLRAMANRACVYFYAHDSHVSSKDVYPAVFAQRADKCLQMLARMIDSKTPNGFKCAFPGRKSSGIWRLEYAPKGFGGVHSGRHLYNMTGGNVNEPTDMEQELSECTVLLRLPNKEDGMPDVILYVRDQESAILEDLDNLPWSFLSWSIHRGLRDILTAYSKVRIDSYRNCLANTQRLAVLNRPENLIARGWDSQFVRYYMADMASSIVLARQGNAGDAVRIVTDIPASLCDGDALASDETHFWRPSISEPYPSILSTMTVVALDKCFVLD
ncbi:hypothetical protein N7532_007489, partial [Penicillium argentinense]